MSFAVRSRTPPSPGVARVDARRWSSTWTGRPSARRERWPPVASAWFHAPSGDPEGGVLLWVQDGYLSCLEIHGVGDGPLTEWPEPERLMIEGRALGA
jgi:hypothetical protein